jgi:hypothetical protein
MDSFDQSKWQALPQFFFMGVNDTNDAAQYDHAYSELERQIIYLAMGKTMQPQRWQFCQQMYAKQQANAEFKTSAGFSHGTNLHIHHDSLAFITKNS